jgi:ribosomal protein S18 acetylase RimI-like enzyme
MRNGDSLEAAIEGLRIREAREADREVLVAFNHAMAAETEGLELDPGRLAAGVAALFEDPARGTYYVAEERGEIVASLMITSEWSDWRNGLFWWIQSVYVRPEARGRGVFRSMYRFVHACARAAGGVCGLRLYVEAENRGAQACYASLGMKRTSYQLWEADFVLEEGRADSG